MLEIKALVPTATFQVPVEVVLRVLSPKPVLDAPVVFVVPADEPMNVLKFGWASSHHWIVGDNFGYVIANNGLTDDMTYVGYDTTYITWFSGYEVPIVNGSSYSREDGEVNTMVAPIRTMVGDTATIFYGWYDDWTSEETIKEFYIIFD